MRTHQPHGKKQVSTIAQSAVYDELLDLLVENVAPERVVAFRLSQEKQSRLDHLLERNREGTLTREESTELDDFERLEHLVRLLKARSLQQRRP